MAKYTIYLRRNKVNGKCYVGQTSNFKSREKNWRCLKATYANEHLSLDRANYGLDNWAVEVLGEADNREDAWELEQRFIRDYNTLWPNGYNLAKGGAGPSGCKRSYKTRRKLSESHEGENNPNWGKHLSEETKEKMSEVKKGEKHPMYGKHHSEEVKKKMSEAKAKKPVYQYTLDGVLKKVWPSTNECERNGFNHGAVSQCCNDKLKTYKGHKWSFTPL